ncbi:NAD-dependent DNA ligase LigA [Patescibacteria group bacterium]|nr:NAD-dependent DNA ligase LigA [Patescibacteria group bacterium]
MTKTEAEKRIEKLKKLINHYRYLYHVKDSQEFSPEALDSLKKELFDLEQTFPDLVTPDSPTQRVGGQPLSKFSKARHMKPMLSFNDAFSEQDVKDWLERNIKLLSQPEKENIHFYCEPKLDGLAIELVYSLGKQGGILLKTGSTRGDGLIGEDVTQNLKTIDSIPLRLRQTSDIIKDLEKEKLFAVADNIKNKGLDNLVVRGEAIIAQKEFLKINKEQEKRSLAPYANPRNLAAGSVRQLDPKIAASRNLEADIYDLVTDLGQKTHEQEHKILKALGFKSNNKYNKFCKDIKEVFAFRDFWLKKRQTLPYEIDGIVVVINNNEIFNKLGVVGKAPRGAIAFKFPLKQATTIVEDIKLQVGRTGAITPVAVLKPVKLAGVVISRATLHNQDEIERLGLKIKDTVIVGRAGDVIPDIIKVLPELRTGQEKEFIWPKTCPSCGANLLRLDREVVLRCSNKDCFARTKNSFYHFVSKGAFNIEGLGPKIIDRLLAENLIKDPSDLFLLEPGDLVVLERFAEKSANNLISALRDKKKISFSRFIFSLGIRNVGEVASQDLAFHFKNLDNLKQATLEDFQAIKNIGPIAAQAIADFFKNKKNLEFLDNLIKAGVKIENQQQSQQLAGLKFVITGSLKTITRDQAKEKIFSLGGLVSEAVSLKTDFVIIGLNPGSKFEKAKKLKVKTISEADFLKIVS